MSSIRFGLLMLAVVSSNSMAANSHYLVTVAPGSQEAASIGSYGVWVYEGSRDNFIAGLIAPRNGTLQKTWVIQPTAKQPLQIFVWTVSVGSGSYGTLNRYQLDNKKLQAIPLPSLSPAQQANYQGHDQYQIADHTLWRWFHIADQDSRCLSLSLKGEDSWQQIANHSCDKIFQ